MSLVLNVEILGEFRNLTKATQGSQNELTNLNKKISGFSKSAKAAFASIGVGLSFAIIASQLGEATKAAVEDRKSQELLANQLENTTGATKAQIAQVEKQISKLQLSAAVADDKLRPAFSQLVRTTGSSTEAMKLLNLATEVSAGSGKSLETVTNALSKAYQGKTAALVKLGIPMSDSIQNASDYTKEMTKLNTIQREVAGTTGKDHAAALEKLALQQDKVNRIAAAGIDWQSDLAKAFEGSAEKAANIDPYQRMQIVFGEIQEEVGERLLPILDDFSTWLATPEGSQRLDEIVELIKDVLDGFVAVAQWVIKNKDWLVPVVIALGAVKLAWEGVTIATGLAKAAQITFGTTAVAQAGLASAAWGTVSAAIGAIAGFTAPAIAGAQEFISQIENDNKNAPTTVGVSGNSVRNPAPTTSKTILPTAGSQTVDQKLAAMVASGMGKQQAQNVLNSAIASGSFKPAPTTVNINVKTTTDAKTALQQITGLSSSTGVPKSLLLK